MEAVKEAKEEKPDQKEVLKNRALTLFIAREQSQSEMMRHNQRVEQINLELSKLLPEISEERESQE